MAQYCRYCIHLATGNGIWCGKREKILSESYAKCPNRCKDFEFCEIDAFMENHRPYRPPHHQKERCPPAGGHHRRKPNDFILKRRTNHEKLHQPRMQV